MVVTKKTTKPVVKKEIAKTSKPEHGAQVSLLKWFFKPDTSQGIWQWIFRAVLFSAVITMISPRFAGVTLTGIAFAFGMFLFMPRRYLDRESFVATSWTFAIWFLVFTGLGYAGAKQGLSQWGILLFAIASILSATGLLASITCFARKVGVSKIATFLNFPVGITFVKYIGYFLPVKDENVIAVKYNWYRGLISFLLNTKKGQILLLFVVLFLVAISQTPWELLFLLLFGSLYFMKRSNWMIQNIKKLTWASAAINIVFVTAAVIYVHHMMNGWL